MFVLQKLGCKFTCELHPSTIKKYFQMKKYSIILFVTLLFLATSCYYDSQESLFPSLVACDSAKYSFKTDILPMINSNCNGCHNNTAPDLTTYNNIKSNASTMYNDIVSGKMPKGGSPLDDCSKKQFKKWMDYGMPQN